MARLKLFIPLLLFIALVGFLYQGIYDKDDSLTSALLNKPFPAFSLPTVQSAETNVGKQALLGEVALVNVWATWCPSCQVEHPYLLKLAQQGVKIIGVNYKDDRAAAQQWLTKLKNPYVFSVFDEKGRLGLDLGVYGAPETYLIDREGVIRYKHVGVVDEQVWLTKIKPKYDALKMNTAGTVQQDAG
ncbi:DsbE family thiol:disulfide interchange protein [Endozoicomonas sp. SM1973]|uniref:DsbE family thiol:disulfide interchange protein n=1 Tax=Spartinivicinus marinus TaxID=2994442 RepID=A0A853HYM2_9GAMM|nr:DsbE family thiol:disulfide interchange protein [Spartinivicinus marinus]MCX4028958.1 DsbE family thiol:disulfide interchange protein [Spartinivicinus marinus]NYZ65459.1 DsbE family thiol:disulfide interchange protein [Spartinivicinus marinus]